MSSGGSGGELVVPHQGRGWCIMRRDVVSQVAKCDGQP